MPFLMSYSNTIAGIMEFLTYEYSFEMHKKVLDSIIKCEADFILNFDFKKFRYINSEKSIAKCFWKNPNQLCLYL